MKKIILLLLFSICTNSFGQFTVSIKDNKIDIVPGTDEKNIILVKKSSVDPGKSFSVDSFDSYCNDTQDFDKLKCVMNCTEKTITFNYPEANLEKKFYLCSDKKIFTLAKEDCGKTGDPKAEKPKDLIVFPLKDYTPVSLKTKKCNRILVIDAKADKYTLGDETGLYRYKTEVSTDGKLTLNELKVAEALPVNSYLAVVIRNYNFHDLERFSIEVNGENYTYEQDIRKIYDLVVGSDPAKDIQKSVNTPPEDKSDKALLDYLKEVNRILATYTNGSLNLNDLYKVEEFKLSLINYYNENKDTKFGYMAKLEMQKIISWYPANVSLTPISIDVPENDQVEIEYTMKNRNSDATKKSLGNFKTFGGVSVDYGAAFYLTDLRNNEVYTKSTGADADKDTRAVLAQTNEESIGFGLNIDVSYRTGLHFRPTFNFGFFVPLEEEVTPFIATGPGIGFYNKNYKINFSWGLSLGKVNSIKEQYKDVNLEGLNLTNTDLTEKVLKSGHYYSLSISFNL